MHVTHCGVCRCETWVSTSSEPMPDWAERVRDGKIEAGHGPVFEEDEPPIPPKELPALPFDAIISHAGGSFVHELDLYERGYPSTVDTVFKVEGKTGELIWFEVAGRAGKYKGKQRPGLLVTRLETAEEMFAGLPVYDGTTPDS